MSIFKYKAFNVRKDKLLISASLAAIALYLAFSCTYFTASAQTVREDVVRLHVLANSDSEEDQKIKLKVRDAVLSEYGSRLASLEDKAAAEATVKALLPDIEKLATETVKAEGYCLPVTATLSREKYDRRTYESFTMPAGEYLSLRIVLGEGAGQNWWCVLFPPLCTELAVKKEYGDGDLPVGLTPEEYELITGETGDYRVRFKLLETLSAVLNP